MRTHKLFTKLLRIYLRENIFGQSVTMTIESRQFELAVYKSERSKVIKISRRKTSVSADKSRWKQQYSRDG